MANKILKTLQAMLAKKLATSNVIVAGTNAWDCAETAYIPKNKFFAEYNAYLAKNRHFNDGKGLYSIETEAEMHAVSRLSNIDTNKVYYIH